MTKRYIIESRFHRRLIRALYQKRAVRVTTIPTIARPARVMEGTVEMLDGYFSFRIFGNHEDYFANVSSVEIM